MIQQDLRALRTTSGEEGTGPARMIQHIVVPLDGSPFAERALGWAVPIARYCGAEIVLVRAYVQREDHNGGRYALPWRYERNGLHSASLYLARQEQELRRRGVRVALRTAHGDPADVIAAVVRQCDAELLILATHDRHGSPLASVAQEIMSRCEVPTLLLTAETRAPHTERRATVVLLPHGTMDTAESTHAEQYGAIVAAVLGGTILVAPPEGAMTTEDVGAVILPLQQARPSRVSGTLSLIAQGGAALLLLPQAHHASEGGLA